MYKYKLIDLNDLDNHKKDDVKQFMKFNGIIKFDECDIDSLLKLSKFIKMENKKGFNISYNISRIDKEFDLVKTGNGNLINIELKLSTKDVEQCKKNYVILKKYYKDYDIYVFCYEKDSNKLYIYNDQNKSLIETNFKELNELLSKIKDYKMLDIDVDISSIYSNPDFFLNKKYELSNSQNITKGKVLKELDFGVKKIILISGRAGTGKTLLALDLMEEMQNVGKNVVYLTPFKLYDIVNIELINKYNMQTVKSFVENMEEVDFVIIDEAQRLKYLDLNKLNSLVKGKIIVLGDINQNIDSESCFEQLYNDRNKNEVYNMNQVIRSDDTFDLFAKKILGISTKGVKNKQFDSTKIEIVMLSEEILNTFNEYTFLETAKSLRYKDCRDECNNRICSVIADKCIRKGVPYNVIGKEFDKVVILFCDGFKVYEDEIIATKTVCIGSLKKQLYSIITRCTTSLKIIVTDIVMYNYLSEKLEQLRK